jgi:serine/threonine protein kinase
MTCSKIKLCFRENDTFGLYKNKKGFGYFRKLFDEPALMECLESPDAFLDYGDIMKDSRTTKAALSELPNGKKIFIKRFNNKGTVYTAKYLFRHARPFRVWRIAWAMEQAKIPTPMPMAAFAEYKFGIPGNAYLIREVVDNVIETLDFFKLMKSDNNLSESFLKNIASLFKTMHDKGIYHGDAKCSNIFVTEKNGKFEYGVWDLLSCKLFNADVPQKFRQKELKHIAWSFAEISNRNSNVIDEIEINEKLNSYYLNKN